MGGALQRLLQGSRADIEYVEESPEVQRAFNETRVALAQALGIECLTHVQMAGNNCLGGMRQVAAMGGDELTNMFNARAQADYNIVMQRIKMGMFLPVKPQSRRKR